MEGHLMEKDYANRQ